MRHTTFTMILTSLLCSSYLLGCSFNHIPPNNSHTETISPSNEEAVRTVTARTNISAPAGSVLARADYQAFANQVSREHGFTRSELDRLFAQVSINPEIIARITKPAEGIAWHRYQNIFIKTERMAAGRRFWQENQGLLEAAQRQYGVPPEIICAIIGVETYYGRFKGKYPVLEALATLGFEYPKRGAFFRKQLAAFLVLARDNQFDPLAIKGSYAGAMGFPQFIPTSYQAYAVDGDADGVIDLFNNRADAIFSVANYFQAHVWQPGQPVTYRIQPSDSTGTAWQRHENTNNRGQTLNTTIQQLVSQGMPLPLEASRQINSGQLDPRSAARIFSYEQPEYTEYWLALPNFYTITRYNHSHLYALAVHQLAQGILAQPQQ